MSKGVFDVEVDRALRVFATAPPELRTQAELEERLDHALEESRETRRALYELPPEAIEWLQDAQRLDDLGSLILAGVAELRSRSRSFAALVGRTTTVPAITAEELLEISMAVEAAVKALDASFAAVELIAATPFHG